MEKNQSKIEIILSAVDRGLTSGFQQATGQLKAFFTQSKQVETGLSGMGRAVAGVVASLGATVSAAAGMQKLVGVTREFDKLEAGLITSTGSAEKAQMAFAALQDFASKTPYGVAEVTDSFIKLVNFGLDPSERALESYGNTSSALGKTLNQMIEAVADAATGEFERLKEFGIKSKSEGDKVSFTFRGVTTTVGKNAKEIEEYLIKLGEVNFSGAMANQMKTLNGTLTDLQREWDRVFLNISKAGIGDRIAEGVRVAVNALKELTAMIASGELEGYLRAMIGQFRGWADDVRSAIDLVGKWWTDFTSDLDEAGKASVDGLSTSFSRFPENVRAFIGLMTVHVMAGFDKVAAYARAFKSGITAIFSSDTFSGVGAQLERELQIINDARDQSTDAILAERDAITLAAENQRTQAQLDRIAYNEKRAAEKSSTKDRTAEFRIQGEQAAEASKANKGAAAEAKKAAAEAKKLYEEQKRVAAEKMRAASQEKILAMEKEKIAVSQLPTELARAEAELAIDRRIMEERVSLKRQELAAIKADKDASQADIVRAESDLAELQVQNEIRLNDRLRDLAGKRMDDVERSWRRGIASAQAYQAAVREALAAGAIDQDEANERLIASGDDMGAAISLGFQHARERMQSDAEMMIAIGEQLGDRISDGLVSAWDSFITGTASAKEAMIDFARSTISWLSQIILKQMLMNALFGERGSAGNITGGLFGMLGFSEGGQALALAGGGSVGGWSPSKTADNIPAWLTAGEFVHPVRAVDYYGLAFMERIRRLQLPRNLAHALAGGTLPSIPSGFRLAQGGMPAAGPAATVKGGDVKLAVVNVRDESEIHRYVNSANFDTILLNKISRNGRAIKTILGT